MGECEVPKLLAIDDEPQSLQFVKDALSHERLEIFTESDPRLGLEMFKRVRPQMVLLDLMMPGIHGLEMLDWILAEDPGAEVILMTGHYSTESAVEAIQKGACDYLNKPLSVERLRSRVATLLSEAESRRKTLELDQELLNACQFEGIVGRSPVMLDVFAKIRRVAPHFRNVLVTGATGTGKELVAGLCTGSAQPPKARLRSATVPRLWKRWSKVNCLAMYAARLPALLKTKLAYLSSPIMALCSSMRLVSCHCRLRLSFSAFCRTMRYRRVGLPVTRTVEVRVIAATNGNLRSLVDEGKFRGDLHYRLAMVEISLPRLMDRREDMPLLQRHFLEKFTAQYNKSVTGITRRAQNACRYIPGPAISVNLRMSWAMLA